jgi:hypothetical protein
VHFNGFTTAATPIATTGVPFVKYFSFLMKTLSALTPYALLGTSSKTANAVKQGSLWIVSCNLFYHYCEGHGTDMPTGTDTNFCIPVSAIQKGHKKATILTLALATFHPPKN